MIRLTLEQKNNFETANNLDLKFEGIALGGFTVECENNEVVAHQGGSDLVRTDGGQRLAIKDLLFKLPKFSFKRELIAGTSSDPIIFKWSRNKTHEEAGLREAWDVSIGNYNMLVIDTSYSKGVLTRNSLISGFSSLDEEEIICSLGVQCYFWCATNFENNY